jgi:hypothetical protein
VSEVIVQKRKLTRVRLFLVLHTRLGNCIGWILYSFLTKDFFLFAANISGLILSIWFNLSASNLLFKQQVAQLPDVIKVLDSDERSGDTVNPDLSNDRVSQTNLSAIDEGGGDDEMAGGSAGGNPQKDLENQGNPTSAPITELPVFYNAPVHNSRVMAMSLLWIIVFSVIGFGENISANTKELIVGSVTNFCLVFFYAAPLSCIAVVLKTRNTATLHVPTMFTNTASSVFWGVYGFGVMDFFVAVPNLIGFLLGVAQIVLYMIYPRVETISVPVITAAIPVPGATVGEDGTTEMEVVQLQLHNVATDDLLGHSNMLGNTNAGDPSNNPMNMAYGIPSDGNDDSNTITTLHKHEITMDGVTAASTENPLVLQYNAPIDSTAQQLAGSSVPAPPEPVPFADISSNTPGSRIGVLHRRTSSRGADRLLEISNDNSSASTNHGRNPSVGSGSNITNPLNVATVATVATVHHRRIVSNSDSSSFLAGLFASDHDILSMETTTSATLHRRVLSTSTINSSSHNDSIREHQN